MDISIKVTIGLTPETQTILEGFISSFSGNGKPAAAPGTTSVKKTNGMKVDKPSAEGQPLASTVITNDVTIEIIRAEVQSKSQAGKREAVKALLTEFEVVRVTDLPNEKYAGFYTKVQAL